MATWNFWTDSDVDGPTLYGDSWDLGPAGDTWITIRFPTSQTRVGFEWAVLPALPGGYAGEVLLEPCDSPCPPYAEYTVVGSEGFVGLGRTEPFDTVEFWVYGLRAVAIDNVRYDVPEPVPEPGSLLLFGTGLVGLRAWRKRRQ